MIKDPLLQFMLTAEMTQVLRIITDDDVIEISFDNAERLEDISRAFKHRAVMLRFAETAGWDFDQTLEHFDRPEAEHYDDEITDDTVDDIIHNIFGDDPHAEH